jgi:hypothetical protein
MGELARGEGKRLIFFVPWPEQKGETMKKVIVSLLGFLFLIAPAAFAHPPTNIVINFDQTTQQLTAVVTHPVTDVTRHYIKKVDIAVNGKEITTLKFTQQDNTTTQPVSYQMKDIRPGDVIEIEGYCSIQGKLAREMKVK